MVTRCTIIEYDIQFNTAKCQLIKYGESDDVPFYFNGTLIEYVRHGVHIGHSIGPVTHCYMVRDVARDFVTHMNGILANFNYCDLQTKYRLFVSYCTSTYVVEYLSISRLRRNASELRRRAEEESTDNQAVVQ